MTLRSASSQIDAVLRKEQRNRGSKRGVGRVRSSAQRFSENDGRQIVDALKLKQVLDPNEVLSFVFEAQLERRLCGEPVLPIGLRVASRMLSEAKKRIKRTLRSLPDDFDPSYVPVSVDPDVRDLLIIALGTLPEAQRHAFVLRVLEDQSFKTIGTQLNCDEGTARTHYRRAREALSERAELRALVA